MSEIVIAVENISKQYRLGTVGRDSLKDDFKRLRYKLMGESDPFLTVGDENVRHSESNSNYVWALKGINFNVNQGDIVGIIGMNGAGKSTLLKILSRTTNPTTGLVKIKGRIASLLEVGTGFHGELSGRENIFLNGTIMGLRKQEIKKKFDEIINFAGVERYIDTPVKRYSSGMYVRLAFSVAAHLEPDILIVDEVLAVGDTDFQRKCLQKMKDISQMAGRTVIFVSHNMTIMKSLCKNAILLENGKAAFSGNVNDAIFQYIHGSNTNAVESNIATLNNLGIQNIFLTNLNGSVINDISAIDYAILNFELINQIEDSILGLTIYDENDEPNISAHSTDNQGGFDKINTMKLTFPAKYLVKGRFRVEINLNGKNYESAFYFTKSIPTSKFISAGNSSKSPLVTIDWS